MGYYGDQLSQAESISLTASPLLCEGCCGQGEEQSFIPTTWVSPLPVHLSTPRMGQGAAMMAMTTVDGDREMR